MSGLHLKTPLSTEDAVKLRAGDQVFLSGIVYSARDAAHRRLMDLLEQGKPLPFDPQGAVIYYVGPTPAPAGRPIGAAGPTTSGRMDAYTPRLYALGVKASIGKGRRNAEVRQALRDYGGVYLGATGGAGALLSLCIEQAEVIAFADLGPEAIYKLVVKDFPVLVINDSHGNSLYPEV